MHRPHAAVSRRTLLAALGTGVTVSLLAACAQQTSMPRPAGYPPIEDLLERYGHLGLTDVHNHGAGPGVGSSLRRLWADMKLRRVVLFGSVSEPRSVSDDEDTWRAFLDQPDLVVPFFCGFDLRDESCLDVVREKLDRGFVGLGEVAAASSFSEAVSDSAWKGHHPMDGFLPRIYEICAEYGAPILLHIDPLSGGELARFEEALDSYPHTTFIIAHVNAYTPPHTAAALLAAHDNLYADFYAGFTDRNPASSDSLQDFVAVARDFPDRWLLGSDSGYGIGGEAASVESMYRFIHLLDDEPIARKIAFENFDRILAGRQTTT